MDSHCINLWQLCKLKTFRQNFVPPLILVSHGLEDTPSLWIYISVNSLIGIVPWFGELNQVFIFIFLQYPLMSMRIAGAAAQDWVVTHHGPPPSSSFHLGEDSMTNLASVFAVFPLGPLIFYTFAGKVCWGAYSVRQTI